MRGLFVIVGFLFVLILLVTTGLITGEMCVEDLGCLRSSQQGVSLGK
jgi:hypothetical protein